VDALGLTFDYLATTENEAASVVLMAALEHRDRAVGDRALHALLRRKSSEALDQLVSRWHTMCDRWKQIAAERPGVLTDALRNAFHSADEQLIRNAADAAIVVCDYDLAAMFAQAASDQHLLRRRLAGEAVLRICEMLYDELHGGSRCRTRHDPQCVRGFVVGSLESPVARFAEHNSREMLEAFLLVAPRECATLRHLLQDTHEPAHQPLCDQLLRSTRPGVMRLLLSIIDDPHAPLSALRIIGRRHDVGFFRQLCKKLVDDRSPRVDTNLARIDQLPWLDEEGLPLLESVSEAEQPGAALLVARAKIPEKDRRRVLRHLLKTGSPQGRQAAARLLIEILGEEGDLLLLELIEDPCPLVQAEAARHLRARDIPDATTTLIEMLDSPHPEVQAAARESLEEYSFARFLTVYDSLSTEARRTTGSLVKRVNPNLVQELLAELMAVGRARRLRAMDIATLLKRVPDVVEGLIELSRDESHTVRLEAARRLGECTGTDARSTLRELLADPSSAVQQMAEQALQEMARREPLETTVGETDEMLRETEALP